MATIMSQTISAMSASSRTIAMIAMTHAKPPSSVVKSLMIWIYFGKLNMPAIPLKMPVIIDHSEPKNWPRN